MSKEAYWLEKIYWLLFRYTAKRNRADEAKRKRK